MLEVILNVCFYNNFFHIICRDGLVPKLYTSGNYNSIFLVWIGNFNCAFNYKYGLDVYMMRIARLGGYLDRWNDAPPDATVMWRGFSRLADLVDGFAIRKGKETPMGNDVTPISHPRTTGIVG